MYTRIHSWSKYAGLALVFVAPGMCVEVQTDQCVRAHPPAKTHPPIPGSNLLLVRLGQGGPLVRQLPGLTRQLSVPEEWRLRAGCPLTRLTTVSGQAALPRWLSDDEGERGCRLVLCRVRETGQVVCLLPLPFSTMFSYSSKLKVMLPIA